MLAFLIQFYSLSINALLLTALLYLNFNATEKPFYPAKQLPLQNCIIRNILIETFTLSFFVLKSNGALLIKCYFCTVV